MENRTIDGSGNNLENPKWGAAGEPLIRNTTPAYEGLDGPSGSNRPNPRLISDTVCAQIGAVENEQGLSDYMWAWGQFLDHELDLSPEADPKEEFEIPAHTPGGKPIGFGRAEYDRSTGTSINNPRQQVNVLSSFIDAANVYGTNAARAAVLRAFDGSGKLRIEANGLLPKNPGGLPNAPAPIPEFYIAGDIRANEHVVLTCLHTLFVREHNRVCDILATDSRFQTKGMMPKEEDVYQHARKIVGGIMQAITYNEFLPALLGEHALRPYNGYNQNVNPTICNIFSTAAYRLGHSMLSPEVQRIGLGPIPFKDTFFSPQLVEQDGIEPYLAGAATGRMQKIDTKAVDAVRKLLFVNTMGDFAPMDLAALNIQRGRDHGLPDYNQCRKDYGLQPRQDIRDVTSDAETQLRLKQAYDNDVSLIDPWVGGLADDHYADGVVGEFFFHVLKDQFERLRDGDRFWYEVDPALSDKEKNEIRKTTLAKVILQNTNVTKIQPNVFQTVSASSVSIKRTVRKKKSSRKKSVTKTRKATRGTKKKRKNSSRRKRR